MSQRDLRESASSSSSSQPSQQLQPRASFSALSGSASSRSLTRAPRQHIPRHLVFRTEPLYQLNNAFNPEFNGYQGEVTTAYGVKHPKEFIRYFQKKVLWGINDINLVLANFLQNSDMYQKLNEGKIDNQANPLYKLHLNKKLAALASDPQIEEFGQIKYLLDAQFPKIKTAVKDKRKVFEKMKNDFIIIETVLEHNAGNIELYDNNSFKKSHIEHRHIINLQVLLQDALIHIKLCAKKRKINLADNKEIDDSLNNIELKHIKSFVSAELPIELKKAYNITLSEGFDLLTLYKRVEKYIAFLQPNVAKIIEDSEDLQVLHNHRLALLEALNSLNINTFDLVNQGPSSIMRDYSRAYIARNLRKCGALLIENLNPDSKSVEAVIKQMLDLASPQELKAASVSAVSEELSADSVGPSLVTIYKRWFASIYSACLNSTADYARLMDLVKTSTESGKDLHQGSSKKGTSTLFTAKSRVDSALVLSPEIKKDSQVIQEAKNIVVPFRLDNLNIDLLHYLLAGSAQILIFTDCLTVQEQLHYVTQLTKLLSNKSVDISGHIAFQRASLIASTVKSDAFILRVPSDSKSLSGLTCLANPHEYARSLVAELKSDKRAGLWTAILDFADLYLQLVSKIHFIQLDIGRRSDLNKSSDEAINAILNESDSSFKEDIYLFLELVGKIQTAAIQLKKLLAPLEEGDEARISDIYWQTASKAIRAFISGVYDFNVMFEASCNQPTTAMWGTLKSPENLKNLYRNLYLRFNYFLDANSRIAPWNEAFELKPAPKSLLVMPELSQSLSIAPASVAPRLDREASVSGLDESKRESKKGVDDPFELANVEDNKVALVAAPQAVPELRLSNQEEVSARLGGRLERRVEPLTSSNSSSSSSSASSGSSSSQSSDILGIPAAPPIEGAASSLSAQSSSSNSSSSSSSASSVSLGSSSSGFSDALAIPVPPPIDLPIPLPIEGVSNSSSAELASSSSSFSSSSERPREQKEGERNALLASIQGFDKAAFFNKAKAAKAAKAAKVGDDKAVAVAEAKDKPVQNNPSQASVGGLAGALQRSLTLYRSRVGSDDDTTTAPADEWSDDESSAGPKG